MDELPLTEISALAASKRYDNMKKPSAGGEAAPSGMSKSMLMRGYRIYTYIYIYI